MGILILNYSCPIDWGDFDWGFYRRGCFDRVVCLRGIDQGVSTGGYPGTNIIIHARNNTV